MQITSDLRGVSSFVQDLFPPEKNWAYIQLAMRPYRYVSKSGCYINELFSIHLVTWVTHAQPLDQTVGRGQVARLQCALNDLPHCRQGQHRVTCESHCRQTTERST